MFTLGALRDCPCIGPRRPALRRRDVERGRLLVRLFAEAQGCGESGSEQRWRVFFNAWQRILAAAPPQPLLVNLTATHHELADLLERVSLLDPALAEILLPCRDCGCVFTVRRRGGRYRRTCGRCRPLLGAGLAKHAAAGLRLDGGASYPRWRPDASSALEDAVEARVCAHDGCGARFLTSRPDQIYCAEHGAVQHRVARHRNRRGM